MRWGMKVEDLVISKPQTSLRLSPFICVGISGLWMPLISAHCPGSIHCSLAVACTPVKNDAPL